MVPSPDSSKPTRRSRLAPALGLMGVAAFAAAAYWLPDTPRGEPLVLETTARFQEGYVGESPALAPVDLPTTLRDALDTEDTCEAIGNKLGSVSKEDCLELGLRPSGTNSVSGTPILVKEYPPNRDREPVGRVLLVGGIHGDEYSAISIVFKWLAQLDVHHSGLFHWQTTPLLNPDGLLRQYARRTNGRGVDLNRNFPSPDWEAQALAHWREKTGSNSRKYPGPSALSEPESQWLEREIRIFQPDAIVTVHAPLHTLDYDGPPQAPSQLGSLHLDQIGTYPGSLGRFAGEHLGIPVLTLELPSAGALPPLEEQLRIWNDLIDYLESNIPLQRQARQESPAMVTSP